MPSIRLLDTVLMHQAIITGRVTDALNGEAIGVTPLINLAWSIDGVGDYLVAPHEPSIKAGGYFVFSGSPQHFFPPFSENETLACRLTIRATGYQEDSIAFGLKREDVTLETVKQTLAGHEVDLKRLNTPVRQLDIALTPDPISLAGRVIKDHDLNSPVAGATVSIISPPAGGNAVTNALGYFRINDLSMMTQVTVEIRHNGKKIEAKVYLDMSRRINERIFSFEIGEENN
jgi:hypothetical protein